MALSDTTVRPARITGNDYTLGDTDGLALNVTARGGKIWRFNTAGRACRSVCLWVAIRKCCWALIGSCRRLGRSLTPSATVWAPWPLPSGAEHWKW